MVLERIVRYANVLVPAPLLILKYFLMQGRDLRFYCIAWIAFNLLKPWTKHMLIIRFEMLHDWVLAQVWCRQQETFFGHLYALCGFIEQKHVLNDEYFLYNHRLSNISLS